MGWIKTSERLPKEGKYVIARHNRNTWHDSTDQKNVNCVVVKLIKGITEEERALLPDTDDRKRRYTKADISGNNLVPYHWEQFGPDSFFGQNIDEWIEIPEQ